MTVPAPAPTEEEQPLPPSGSDDFAQAVMAQAGGPVPQAPRPSGLPLAPAPVALPSNYKFTSKAWTSAPPNAPDDYLDQVMATYEEWGQDPAFANDISRRWWATLTSPEVIAGIWAEAGGVYIPEADHAASVLTAAIGDPLAPEQVEVVLDSHPLVAEWFSRRGNEFRSDEKQFLFWVLAAVEPNRRDRLVALAEQYLHNSPLADQGERDRFLAVFLDWGRQQQAEGQLNETGFGRLGEFVAAPFRAVSSTVRDAYIRLVDDPEDYRWRRPLSLGQNMAITFGVDPSDEQSWAYTSGSFDFLANFVLDPINLAVGLGIGNKLARTVPRAGQLAERSRLWTAAHAVVPWHGRRITQLPRFSRGPYTRLGWALKSKTVDALVETARKAGVYDDLAKVVKGGGGVQEIIERYPQLRHTMEGLGQLMASPRVKAMEIGDAANEIEEIMRAGFYTVYKEGEKADLLRIAELDLKHAQDSLSSATNRAMAEGSLDPKTLSGFNEGIDRLMTGGAAVYEVRLGGLDEAARIVDWSSPAPLTGAAVLRRADDQRGAFIVLQGGGTPRVLDLGDANAVRRLSTWLSSHAELGSGGAADTLLTNLSELIAEHGDAAELPFMLMRRLEEAGPAGNAARDLLMDYAARTRTDLIGTDTAAILTPHGANRAIRGLDTAEALDALDVLRPAKVRVAAAERRLAQLRAQDARTFFVKDFPTHPPRAQFIKGGWRKHGSATTSRKSTDGWWRNFRNRTSTTFFNPKNAREIDLVHADRGAQSLGSFLRRMGLRRDFINDWINRFAEAVPEVRYDIVRDAIEAAAQEIDHPMLSYGIIEQIRKQGLRTYAYDANGAEVGVAWGRANRGGIAVAQPVIPSHTHLMVQLPGPEVFSALRRFRRANRNFAVLPAFSRGLVRGAGNTARKRKNLAERYRSAIAKSTGQSLEAIDDEMVMAMAYATTRPYRYVDLNTGRLAKTKDLQWEDGLGIFARVGLANHRLYGLYHSTFSLMQLMGRPISWASRVLLEEQWRAAMFDMPSFFRNPLRQMGGWYDTFLTSRRVAWSRKQSQFVRSLSAKIFDGLPADSGSAAALVHIRHLVPEFEELAGKALPTSTPELRSLFSRVMTREVVENGKMAILDPAVTPARFARMRARKIRLSEDRIEKIGLRKDFTWHSEEMAEIRNKGFTQLLIEEAAASSFPIDLRPGATSAQLYNAGTAYSRILKQFVDDPIMGEYGLGRIIERAGHGAPLRYTAANLIETRAWRTMRNSVRRQADYQISRLNSTLDAARVRSDRGLAEWYLRDIIDPMVDNYFGPILGKDLDGAAAQAAAIMRTKSVTVQAGRRNYTLDFDTNDLHWLAHNTREFVRDQINNPDMVFPPRLAAFFEARFLGEGGQAVRPKGLQRIVRSTMAFFGDEASQWMNRRPGWLAAYKDHYRHYRAAGMTEKMAQTAAEMKATEVVNWVFYNLDNIVPVLRKINKFSPFFSAWWEVAQTWAYKIPMTSSWGLGYVGMVRKVDRFIDALVSTGIVRVGEVDEESPTGTRQLKLEFSSDPDTRNPLGQMLSKAGFYSWRAPAVAIDHLVNIANFWTDDTHGDAEGWKGRDTWTLSVGVPTDPFSHGLGAVNQAYPGTNPLVGHLASKALEQLGNAVDYQIEESAEGDTIASFAARIGQNTDEFMAVNRALLLETYGREEVNRIFSGDTDPATVVLPPGLRFKVPGTNFWMAMMEDLLLPFGRVESPGGTIWNLQPSWMQHFWRGFGLWAGGPGVFEGLDNRDLGDTAAGFLDVFQSPISRAGVAGEVITQIQHLEATERLLTRASQAQQDAWDVVERARGTLIVEVLEGQTPQIVNPDHPLAAEFQEKWAISAALSDELMHRATSNAAGASAIRGIAGLYSPGVPSMLYEQNRELSTFYYGREVAAAQERGDLDLTEITLPSIKLGGEENYRAFLGLLGNWLEDPRGDRNKQFIYDSFPDLWPFIYGKTYWGPSGEPPEFNTIEDWAERVKEGTVEPYDPAVYIQRLQYAELRLSQENDIKMQFGDDPQTQAQNILTNWSEYSDLKKDYDVLRTALREQDVEFYGGAYRDFLRRNDDDNLTLLTYLNDWVSNIGEVIDELADPTANVLLMFDPEERRNLAGQLKTIARSLREAVFSWREQHGTAFEPNERDQILADYFSDPVASYYEGLGNLYEAIDAAQDTEDRSRIYESIRQYENTAGLASSTIRGVNLPSPLEWRWTAMNDEQKGEQLQRWMAARPDWLSRWATNHMIAEYPELKGYLPSRAEDFDIYREHGETLNMLADMIEPGPNGEAPRITTYQRTQITAFLKERMANQLQLSGRAGEILWQEMTPVQRLDLAGILPESLRQFVPMTNAIMDYLDSADKGPGTADGRRLFGYLLATIHERSLINPQIEDDFENLGIMLFNDRAHDSLIMKLFAGDVFEASEL